MTRLVRDYIEVGAGHTLGALVDRLTALRAELPDDSEVLLRGDDLFGRRISIAYLRPLTAEEAACEARYAEAGEGALRDAA